MRCAGYVLLGTLLGVPLLASGEVTFHEPWIREGPAAGPLAGYLVIRNSGPAERVLLAARGELFGAVLFHRTVFEDGMARMVRHDRISVPAGGRAVLEPNGHHLMLMRPVRPLAVGETVTLELQFADGDTRQVTFVVRPVHGHTLHEHGHHHH